MAQGYLLPGYGVVIETQDAGELLPGYGILIETQTAAPAATGNHRIIGGGWGGRVIGQDIHERGLSG